MSPKENPETPEKTPIELPPDAIPAQWPGDFTIPPGIYPDPKRDEVTEVPLVR